MHKNMLAGLIISLCITNYSAALKFTNTMPHPLLVTVKYPPNICGNSAEGRFRDLNVPVKSQETIDIDTASCPIAGISASTNPTLKPSVDSPVSLKYDKPVAGGRNKAFHTVLINNKWYIKEK